MAHTLPARGYALLLVLFFAVLGLGVAVQLAPV
jgi:hypothetical protein